MPVGLARTPLFVTDTGNDLITTNRKKTERNGERAPDNYNNII